MTAHEAGEVRNPTQKSNILASTSFDLTVREHGVPGRSTHGPIKDGIDRKPDEIVILPLRSDTDDVVDELEHQDIVANLTGDSVLSDRCQKYMTVPAACRLNHCCRVAS